MEKRKIIGTVDVLENLKREPDVEQQYTHYLGGILRSTHWLEYKSETQEVRDSMELDEYKLMTEREFLSWFEGHWWSRDC